MTLIPAVIAVHPILNAVYSQLRSYSVNKSTCYIIKLCSFCCYSVNVYLLIYIHSTLLLWYPFSRWIHLLHINISGVKISPIWFWGNIKYLSNDSIYFLIYSHPSILFSFRYQYILHSIMVIISLSTAVDFI